MSCPEIVLQMHNGNNQHDDALDPLASHARWADNRQPPTGLLYCAATVLKARGAHNSPNSRWQVGGLRIAAVWESTRAAKNHGQRNWRTTIVQTCTGSGWKHMVHALRVPGAKGFNAPLHAQRVLPELAGTYQLRSFWTFSPSAR